MSRLGERFAIRPGQHKPKPLRNGLIFLALLGFGLYCGYTRNVPFLNEGGTELKAEFSSARSLIIGNEVRMKGIPVGKVKKIERDDDGDGAIVTMRLKEDAPKLHDDAQAQIYWRTLLGHNMYIEVNPGSASKPGLGGDIPLARTSSQVELDTVLTAFDDKAREGVQTFFREFDRGFGDPEQVARGFKALAPAMRGVAQGLPGLRGTRPGRDLPSLVENAGRTMKALGSSESDLAGLIDHGETALAVTAARRQDIGSMLDAAPSTLRETRVTMARTRVTLDELDPVAESLRPGVRQLPDTVKDTRPALRQATSLLPDTVPMLRRLRTALRNVRKLSRSGVPLMNAFMPTLARTQDDINPWLDRQDSRTRLRNAWAIGPFFSTLGSASRTFDADGHHMRFQPGIGLSSLGENPICTEALARGKDKQAACEAIVGTLYSALGMRAPGVSQKQASRYLPTPGTNRRTKP